MRFRFCAHIDMQKGEVRQDNQTDTCIFPEHPLGRAYPISRLSRSWVIHERMERETAMSNSSG